MKRTDSIRSLLLKLILTLPVFLLAAFSSTSTRGMHFLRLH